MYSIITITYQFVIICSNNIAILWIFALLYGNASVPSAQLGSKARTKSPEWLWQAPGVNSGSSSNFAIGSVCGIGNAVLPDGDILFLYSGIGLSHARDSYEKSFVLVHLSRNGNLIWKRTLPQPIRTIWDHSISVNPKGLTAIPLIKGQVAIIEDNGILEVYSLSNAELISNVLWDKVGVCLYCIDANKRLVWIDITSGVTNSLPFQTECDVNSIVLSRKGNILASCDDGWISEINITGEVLWKEKLHNRSSNESIHESINNLSSGKDYQKGDIVAPLLESENGNIIAINYGGRITQLDKYHQINFSIDLSETGVDKGNWVVDVPRFVTRDRIVCLVSGVLFCISVEGNVIWRYSEGDSKLCSYSCNNERIVCESSSNISGITENGNTEWQYSDYNTSKHNANTICFEPPIIVTEFNKVLAYTNTGIIYCFDTD